MDINWFSILVALGILFIILFLFLWATYNKFIRARNQVKTDFADVDVYLRRRASLIDNLVAVVKEYAKHEKETFTGVAKARSALDSAHSAKDLGKVDNMLTQTMKSLFAVSENYPKLQASDNFKRLQNDLKETEDLIAHHREVYNQSVMSYNTSIQVFPNLLVAGLFGFGEEEFYDAEDTGRAEVHVNAS